MKNVLKVTEKRHESETDHEFMVNSTTVKAELENKCSCLQITTYPVTCKFTYDIQCLHLSHIHPDSDGLKYIAVI